MEIVNKIFYNAARFPCKKVDRKPFLLEIVLRKHIDKHFSIFLGKVNLSFELFVFKQESVD